MGAVSDTNANSKDVAKCGSRFGCRSSGDECVGEGTAEQEGRPNVQEHKCAPNVHGSSISGVAEEPHWIKPDKETDDCDSSVPDKLGYHVGKHKGGPVVSTALAFPMYGG